MALKRMGIVDNYEVNHIFSCKFNLDIYMCFQNVHVFGIFYIFLTKQSPLYNENRVYKT